MTKTPETRESDWHRMIAEAAYYLAEKRGFQGECSLDDWLAAEQQVREIISPTSQSEDTMSDSTRRNIPTPPPAQQPASPSPGASSQFSRFAATQAAGDGIQGDSKKPDKTVDEKIGANMADRK
jgi:Protein of unknown function (DUF2934)